MIKDSMQFDAVRCKMPESQIMNELYALNHDLK